MALATTHQGHHPFLIPNSPPFPWPFAACVADYLTCSASDDTSASIAELSLLMTDVALRLDSFFCLGLICMLGGSWPFRPQRHMDNKIPFGPNRAYLTGLGCHSWCRHAPWGRTLRVAYLKHFHRQPLQTCQYDAGF